MSVSICFPRCKCVSLVNINISSLFCLCLGDYLCVHLHKILCPTDVSELHIADSFLWSPMCDSVVESNASLHMPRDMSGCALCVPAFGCP